MPDEQFYKQRRNLMITSSILIMFYFTATELKSISAGFISAEIKDPKDFVIGLLFMHAYFMYRFYQYYIKRFDMFYGIEFGHWIVKREVKKNLTERKLKASFISGVENINEIYKDFSVNDETEKNNDQVLVSYLSWNNFFNSEQITLYRMNGNNENFKVNLNVFTRLQYILQSTYSTDYLFPILFGTVTLFFGILYLCDLTITLFIGNILTNINEFYLVVKNLSEFF